MIGIIAVWLLGLAGVQPSEDEYHRLTDGHLQRGHHLTFEFGGINGQRRKAPGLGLGWEYIADRPFHGVSVEALATIYGNPFLDKESWWLAGGFGYWPIRQVELFVQAGPLIDRKGVEGFARGGVAYRTAFYHLSVRVYVAVGTIDLEGVTWTIGGRFQY